MTGSAVQTHSRGRTPAGAARVARFYLNGRLCEAAGPWSRTVLDHLRLDSHLTGTKEGCGEGDCGACAVIVCDLDERRALRIRAINSCLAFVPSLDGKYVLTVEGLGADGLHPVQVSMIANHGSQCGYCTPGFVMALAAFCASETPTEEAAIHDALAGNLCRCTGYRPIVDAARECREAGQTWWRATAPKIEAALRDLISEEPSAPTDSSYFAPRSADELASLLARMPEARLVAGATDLGLAVAKHALRPDAAVSVTGVREMQRIEETSRHLRVGAAVTLSALLPVVEPLYPGMGTLLRRFGSPQIRNLATVGGNLCTASPIGDLAPALLALDAVIHLRSAQGARDLPIEKFFTGYRRTALGSGEFVEAVTIPGLAENDLFRIYKLSKRYDQDISTVCAGIRLRIERGRIAEARVAMGGMAPVPKRAAGAEAALAGQAFSAAAIERALPALARDFAPIADLRGSADYRRAAAANLLWRFWLEAGAGATADVMAL